ncbi:MAG TPA: 16S rRNA (cytidine(1402)-2'-O)-methyltransferase [Acidobacteriota bacterium]|jgi:16S rRNA (cytidine1402-2'-O)-methyltransferase
MSGILYVVATPIGNLKDITLRALEVLGQVACIACEDTRVTSKLLRHYGIQKPLTSYHEHNEKQRSRELVGRLKSGESVALLSDAGTPGLSDPGAHLVHSAVAAGIRCVPVPGASALPAILSISGWEMDRLTFLGFAPARASQLQKFLVGISEEGIYCFYESPHRILKLLEQLRVCWQDPQIVAGRELTKLHEEILRGTAGELKALLEQRQRVLGEFVLLVQRPAGSPKTADESLEKEFERLTAHGEDRKSALRKLAQSRGLSRRELYNRLIKPKQT